MRVTSQYEAKVPGVEQPVLDLLPLDGLNAAVVGCDGSLWFVGDGIPKNANLAYPARFVSYSGGWIFVGVGRDVLARPLANPEWKSLASLVRDAGSNHICGPVDFFQNSEGGVLAFARRNGTITVCSVHTNSFEARTISTSEARSLVTDLRVVASNAKSDGSASIPMLVASNALGELWDARFPESVVVPRMSAAADLWGRILSDHFDPVVVHVAGDRRRQTVSLVQILEDRMILCDQRHFSNAVVDTFGRTGTTGLLWYDDRGLQYADFTSSELNGLGRATELLPCKGWPVTHMRTVRGGCWIARSNATIEFLSFDP
jgi:hypothetical protein